MLASTCSDDAVLLLSAGTFATLFSDGAAVAASLSSDDARPCAKENGCDGLGRVARGERDVEGVSKLAGLGSVSTLNGKAVPLALDC